jgi:hypothetical protein
LEIDRIIRHAVPEMEIDEVTVGRATPLKVKEFEGVSSKSKDLDLRYLVARNSPKKIFLN